jgi:hypothetical protein
MGGNKLSARLGYLRKQESVRPGGHTAKAGTVSRQPSGAVSPPEGWSRAGRYTFVREEEIPFGHPEMFAADPLIEVPVPAEKLLFFDTETTGLSGGAGTIAFLIGTAVMQNQRLRVKQFLLTDFPGEKEYLQETLKTFSPELLFVSYNGKSFDSHLLSSRYIMNRLRFSFSLQLDLLYPARRLWGGMLESCSLASVEQEILGIRRKNDIPGFEIPFTYFRFLETGDFSELLPVARHNFQDLDSLARLFLHMTEIFSDPGNAGLVDRFALGRLLLEHGEDAGVEFIRESFSCGDIRAGRYLGRYYKQSGDYPAAAGVWLRLWEETSDPVAGIELAKHLEHREKDYRRALRITEAVKAGRLFSQAEREGIVHRIKRLRRKLRSAG